MKINIITRCTRPENLYKIKETIFRDNSNLEYVWHIIFDITSLSNIPSIYIRDFNEHRLHFIGNQHPNDMSHQSINKVIDEINDDEWVYVLDDDNILHEKFDSRIIELHNESSNKKAIVFSQYIGGIDFTGLEIRVASPENMKVQKIDMAQFVLKKELIGEKRLKPNLYVADGIFIQELYEDNSDDFIIDYEILCYYNYLSKDDKPYFLPRVLLFGSENDNLQTIQGPEYFEKKLNVKLSNEKDYVSDIASFDPDCLITMGDDYSKFNLGYLSSDFRKRWVHIEDEAITTGQSAYNCAMSYILGTSDNKGLMSVFTPMYKTGNKLYRAYESLIKQTYKNWEWVLVFDSNDLQTLEIAKDIASKDPRVKIYNFETKSKGIIGEVKYRACSLSRGEYLLELDHDDYLLPDTIELVVNAFNKYPDAGFVYTDAAEIDENHNSLKYGKGFAMGYGYYNTETHLGRTYEVAATPNINPITIRHIVSVPNHVRVWKRDTYFQIGGHNRRLSIADDYELIVRTFLHTKFVKIPRCGYLQFQWGGNSQNPTRADIQRRVNTIATHYNNAIKERFEDLGFEDYAYTGSRVPRFGNEENKVNYTYEDF